MLNLPLKSHWFYEIESGRKTIEYRKASPYWSKRFEKLGPGSQVTLGLGYTRQRLQRTVQRIERLPDGNDTDMETSVPLKYLLPIRLKNLSQFLKLYMIDKTIAIV